MSELSIDFVYKKGAPSDASLLQPHIDLNSRLELDHVLLYLSIASMIYNCQCVETPNFSPIESYRGRITNMPKNSPLSPDGYIGVLPVKGTVKNNK